MMENTNEFQVNLEKWIAEIIETEKPGSDITAFRFGINEVEEGYLLYLAGSKNHDEADDEWAAYSPDFLAELELIVPVESEQEWYWMLLQVIYSLGRILRYDYLQDSFLGLNVPIYTGFADGDLYRIK